MQRILALAIHPALYGALIYLQTWHTSRQHPELSPEADEYGVGLLLTVALMAQAAYVVCLIPFVKRVRLASATRVGVFAATTVLVGVPLCMLTFEIGWQVESRWFHRAGHLLFLSAPLLAPGLATVLSAFFLLPRSARSRRALH